MNEVKKFFIVRHGETVWNKEKRIQGHSNTPLTEYGILQAEKTGKKLAEQNIQEIYSSDLGRAIQTSETINRHLGLSIKPVKNLRERKYGILEGITFSELEAKYPDIKEKLYTHNSEYRIPEGESFVELTDRIYNCMNSIAENTQSKRILCVVHGGVLESFFYKVAGLPLSSERHFSLFNSSINIFSVKDRVWQLELWGATDHLGNNEILSL